MGAEPADPVRAMIDKVESEDRVIIFWKTEFEAEGRTHKYLTVYNLSEFKALPERIRAAGVDEIEPLAHHIDDAVRALDGAVMSYRKARGVWRHIM